MKPTMTPADQDAFDSIVQIQGCVGPDSPDLIRFMSYLRGCQQRGDRYDKVINPSLKQYLDMIYKALIPVPVPWTNFPGLFVMFSWGQTVAGLNSTSINSFAIPAPGGPPEWQAAVTGSENLSESDNWGAGALILMSDQNDDDGIDGNTIDQYEKQFLDPGRWTNHQLAAQALAPVWAKQASDLTALSNGQPLDEQACLYLLHLLMVLCNSPTPADRNAVNTIATLMAPKPDPNDPQPNKEFIVRLVYLAMLVWNYPLGDYAWAPDRIAGYLNELKAALRNADPGSATIANALSDALKYLAAYPSYPGVDPDVPNLGVTQRRNVTLAQLNGTWSTYKPST